MGRLVSEYQSLQTTLQTNPPSAAPNPASVVQALERVGGSPADRDWPGSMGFCKAPWMIRKLPQALG